MNKINKLQLHITTQFKKDVKKFKNHPKVLKELNQVIEMLQFKKTLPTKYRDHALKGKWSEYRECHVFPDLLLIYRILEDGHLVLILAKFSSHSELF